MHRDPRDNNLRLLKFAGRQGGYFTAAQALEAGYSYRQQHFHKNRGNWQEIEYGIYRLFTYPETENEELIRWSLWSRNQKGDIQAVVSHDTALAIHEIGDAMPSHIHLTVPHSFRKKVHGGCVLHKVNLSPEDIEKRQGFYVTTPIRTLLDVAESGLAQEQLLAAIKDTIGRGIVRVKHLREKKMSDVARKNIDNALNGLGIGEIGGI
jgi:predicted transcriptional regulator of viral defense system